MMWGSGFLRRGMVITLVVIFLIGGLLSMTLFSVVQISQSETREVMVKANESILERTEKTLTSLENACYVMAYSAAVQNMLTDTEVVFPLVDYHRQVRNTFAIAFACNPSIAGICLYNHDLSYLLSSGHNLYGADSLPDFYRGITMQHYSIVRSEKNSGTDIMLIYPVYSDTETESVIRDIVGYLAVTLNNDVMCDIVEQSDYLEGSLIAFTEPSGEIIFSNQKDSYKAQDTLSESDNTFRTSGLIAKTGWRLISQMESEQISDDLKPVVIYMVIIIFLIIMLFVWLWRYYHRQILQPLDDLQQFMTENTDIHHRMDPVHKPSNEMRMAIVVLNDMLDKIEQSSEQVLESKTHMLQEKTAQQQMEIIAYRNQINPHFLYNTFDCIRGIAYMHNAMEIVEISEALTSMFRYAVKGGNFVTLREELQYMHNYARIIGYRFDGRIEILNQIDEHLYDRMVIRMLLQPLVENAVLHGLEHVVGKGQVTVRAEESGNALRIVIEDNGIGASEEKIGELNRQVEAMQQSGLADPPTHSGVGISNIARRLYLHYGTAASLRFERKEQGIKVEMILPGKSEEVTV